MSDDGFTITHVEEIGALPAPWSDGIAWRPLRHHLGFRAFGLNAKGNNIFPDYRLDIGNQSVIDITTPAQAGKALKYPAGNVIEPYTGTLRVPVDPLQPLPMFTHDRGDAADQ